MLSKTHPEVFKLNRSWNFIKNEICNACVFQRNFKNYTIECSKRCSWLYIFCLPVLRYMSISSEIFSVIFYWTSLGSKLRNVSNVAIKIDPESQNIILNIYMSNVFTYDMLCMHCTCGSWEYSAIILTAGVFWQKWK